MFDFIGWIGMIVLLLAYVLLSAGKLNSKSIIYHILNIIGSILITIFSYLLPNPAWPTMMLNIIFSLVGIFSVYKIIYKKRKFH
ncbi:MAG: hypothetical protein WCJ19_02620 [bacterium]